MTACDRFEREGLLAIERGERLDEDWTAHLDDCQDCTSARAAYERLGDGIAKVAAQLHPPVGWQARVRAEIDQRQSTKTWSGNWRRPWLLVPVGLAAAALALVFVLPRGVSISNPGVLSAPSLTTRIVSGTQTFRGEEFKPGDRIELTGSVGQAAASELRIYLNDSETVLSCSTEPPCVKRDDTLSAETILDLRGRYQAVVLVSDEPLPMATGALDYDLDQALEAGAKIDLGDPFVVR